MKRWEAAPGRELHLLSFQDTLLRINLGLGRSYEDYLISLAKSFMISADNAHAVHPNYPEKADPVNRPHINAGIAVKYNAKPEVLYRWYFGSDV